MTVAEELVVTGSSGLLCVSLLVPGIGLSLGVQWGCCRSWLFPSIRSTERGGGFFCDCPDVECSVVTFSGSCTVLLLSSARKALLIKCFLRVVNCEVPCSKSCCVNCPQYVSVEFLTTVGRSVLGHPDAQLNQFRSFCRARVRLDNSSTG